MSAEAAAIARLLATFDELGISYAIGGSYASSAHGYPRATNDIDVVADVGPDDAARLAGALSEEFYIDADMIRDAVGRASSFNIIHFETMFKMDVFVSAGDSVRRNVLARRVPGPVGDRMYSMVSPEDIVLLKLDWYRVGGEVSERQWRDVLEVLVAQKGRLDMEYLQRQARVMKVQDLLERAMDEAREVD